MVMYEFYCGDPVKEHELVGILPEKRKDPKRITAASVMNWGKALSGNNGDKKSIFYKIVFYEIVAMGEYTGKLVRVTS